MKKTKNGQQIYNDLYKTLIWCLDKKIKEVTILGATGLREDHTLGNLLLLFDFSKYLSLKVITDTGYFTLINRTHIFNSFKGQQVSLFLIDLTIKIKTNNLKYIINNNRLKNHFQGTLNESLEKTFSIRVSHGSILVYQKFNK